MQELQELADLLGAFSDCDKFCEYIYKGELRADGIHMDSIRKLIVKSKNEQEYKELLRKAILGAANSYSGWKYAPIDRVSRFLYEIPFDRIPVEMNYVTDPSKKAILKWRLETAGK